MAETQRRRHDLVRADTSAWASMLAARPDLSALPWVADWAAHGWPLIARRPCRSDPTGEIALGLPLPPSAGKLRLSFTLAPDAIGATEPPPLLSVAAASAPPAWGGTIDRLIALDPDVRVFGALAWQALTGLPYLSATSDIDLLWPAPPADRIAARLTALETIEAGAPMRLDGELVRPDGGAANWRELASGAADIMVKRLDGVALETRDAFLEGGRA